MWLKPISSRLEAVKLVAHYGGRSKRFDASPVFLCAMRCVSNLDHVVGFARSERNIRRRSSVRDRANSGASIRALPWKSVRNR